MALLMYLINVIPMLSLCSSVVVNPHLPILDEVKPQIDGSTVPRYSYVYDVQDALTGDFKNHHETREGDLVRGGYSFIESDGTRRIVDYVSDPIKGFNAIVRKEPRIVHPTDPATPNLNVHHHPGIPALIPRHLSNDHFNPIAVASSSTFLPISSTYIKLPSLNYPVRSYKINEPSLINEFYHEVSSHKYLPIGRYGYALTNVPFPNVQPH